MPAGHTEYDLRAASQRRSRCGRQHAVQACRTPSPPLHPAGIDQLAGDFRLTLDQQIGRAPSRRSAVTGNVNPEASTLIPTMATITCGWPRVTPMWTDVPTATCARRSTSTTGRSSTASPSLYTAPAMGTSTMVAVAYFTGQCPWHRRHPRHHEGLPLALVEPYVEGNVQHSHHSFSASAPCVICESQPIFPQLASPLAS